MNRLYQNRTIQNAPSYSSASLTKVTIALDSAYTYGSAGDAFMFGFVPDSSGNLTDLWISVESFTGTWGSTDGVINVQVREDLNGTGIPGTTLVDSFTITLTGSESGWVKKSGLTIALTAGRFYTIVIADADGSSSNYVTLTQSVSVGAEGTCGLSQVYYTTNGFSSAGTISTAPAVCLKVNNIMYGGGIYSSISTDTSGTYKRGNKFTTTLPIMIVGVHDPELYSIINIGATISLFKSPSTTPIKTWTIPASTFTGTAPAVKSWLFPEEDWITLAPNTNYIFTVTPNSALTVPRKLVQITGTDADIESLRPFNAIYIKDNAGSWAETTTMVSTLCPIFMAPNKLAGPRVGSMTGGL